VSTLVRWVQHTYSPEGRRRADEERYKKGEQERVERGAEETRLRKRKRRRRIRIEEEEEENTEEQEEEEETTLRPADVTSSKITEDGEDTDSEGGEGLNRPQQEKNREPPTGGAVPLTGRELVLAKRRQIREALDSILLPSYPEAEQDCNQ
jgi:dTMP kinase